MKCIDCDGSGFADDHTEYPEPLDCDKCGGTGEKDPKDPIKEVAEALCPDPWPGFDHQCVLTVVGQSMSDPNGQPEYGPHEPCEGTGLRWPEFSNPCMYRFTHRDGVCPGKLSGSLDMAVDRRKYCVNGQVSDVTLEKVVTLAMAMPYSQACQWMGGIAFRVNGFGGWFTISEQERIKAACASLLEVKYD